MFGGGFAGLLSEKFRRGTRGIFSEYGGEVAAGAEAKLHGDFGFGFAGKEHFLGQFDFQPVNVNSGRTAGLLAEFQLKLGQGQARLGGDGFQGQLLADIGMNVVERSLMSGVKDGSSSGGFRLTRFRIITRKEAQR